MARKQADGILDFEHEVTVVSTITIIWTGHKHKALSIDPVVAISAYYNLSSHILSQEHRTHIRSLVLW